MSKLTKAQQVSFDSIVGDHSISERIKPFIENRARALNGITIQTCSPGGAMWMIMQEMFTPEEIYLYKYDELSKVNNDYGMITGQLIVSRIACALLAEIIVTKDASFVNSVLNSVGNLWDKEAPDEILEKKSYDSNSLNNLLAEALTPEGADYPFDWKVFITDWVDDLAPAETKYVIFDKDRKRIPRNLPVFKFKQNIS
jgi:hypothetical protein